ncbi:MAG: B12-binding domain-containing radical SAM protein [Acidobacteriota bacterium]|nr:B12-binding domain-containing radical SAM protein [Acidobacteriota bacterium]
MKRILVASAWQNSQREYDIAVWKKRQNLFSVNASMEEHFGLRFLKANVPEIKILEYPTREAFLHEVQKGWDVVGISFYINETNDAVAMAQAARETGAEVWAGNYGALNPQLEPHFDRLFTGWGEGALAELLGREPGPLVHPPVYMHIRYRGIPVQKWGVLFTSRGCNKTCHFCQTPRFYKKPYAMEMDALERVLWEYRRQGVGQVIVLDENFGHFHEHAQEVVDLIHQYRLRWNPLTRVEAVHRNYDDWVARGLCGASMGVESLNQDSLDGAKKGNDLDQIRQVLRNMKRDHLLAQVFYIIGFEEDTEESIRRDILELGSYQVDSPQIQILTPYPQTILYRRIEERYGILDRDLSKYDSTHMVWDHPNVEPAKMRELLFWANDTLFTRKTSLMTLKKLARQNVRRILRRPWEGISRVPLWAGRIDPHAS